MAKKVAKKAASNRKGNSSSASAQVDTPAAVSDNQAEDSAEAVQTPAGEVAPESVASPPQPPTPAITPEQQAAIDKVSATAKEAVAAILGGTSQAPLGTPSHNVEEKQDAVQRDYLPGTKRRDKTYIPRSIYDERNGGKRDVLDYNRFRYCMIPEDDFASYTLNGWKFCHYDGGSRSGLHGDGWQGTGDSVFMRDIRGYCRRGDVFLMYTEIRNYEAIKQADAAATPRSTQAPVGHFADVAYHKGIRAMAQVDGEDLKI